MQKLKMDLKMHRSIVLLCVLFALGAVLRILACFWGYPYQLHPDEGTIVSSAINMISRHSYEAGVYNRPDHFEIKCCAVLFQIVSYIKYHMSADAAFPEHTMVFYLIARAYTSFFGVLTIGMTYKIVEKIRPQAKMIAAVLVTFFPIFVEHSAYATPDVVLSFFVLLVAYQSILYLENPSMKYLALMCVTTGIGITIKYTCAIACIWIAVVVCIDCIRKRKYLDIVKAGIFSIIIVFAVCFFCAPNLFTNMSKTIETLRYEARSTHLGSDGFGFFGNFIFYLTTFLEAAGYETLICTLAGMLFCLKNRNTRTLSMGMGLLFWICTSVLALHVARWGMPMYVFWIALNAIGISYLVDLAGRRWIKSIVAGLGLLMVFNSVVSGILVVQSKLTPDARVDAIRFCVENGITKENTLYDGYSPFNMNVYGTIDVSFDEQGNIDVPSGIQYLIICGNMYSRYYAESERYASQVSMYNNIQNGNQLIYSAGGNYFKHSNIGIINIMQAVKGLVVHNSNSITGSTIKIYRILGDALNLGGFELAYIGDEQPVLDENNHTLKVLVASNEQNNLYLNSNRYRISYHLYDRNGNLVEFEGVRTDFGSFTGSKEIDMEVNVNEISEKGTYTLEIDVVQDGEIWLSQLGLQTERIEIKVQ